jgi:hypothetical protein
VHKGNHPTKHETKEKDPVNEQVDLTPNQKQLDQRAVSNLTGISGQDHLSCNESNMNSDTSQEILKYQQEWAKQFHEQVGSINQKAASKVREYRQDVPSYIEAEIKSGCGMPSSGLTGGDSS